MSSQKFKPSEITPTAPGPRWKHHLRDGEGKGYTLEMFLALSPGDPRTSPSMEKNAPVSCLKGGLGNTSAPLWGTHSAVMTPETIPQLPKWGHCHGNVGGNHHSMQCYSMGQQQGWGHTGPQQRGWGALQRVSSLSAMLAWPAEHLQDLQPKLQL